ncbi:hypothetical protein ELI_2338 [Eubacterium callanderi]|uniref:Uncharacterized protein n=1 Tax=Eubacterium callanderi TaxID=53442 RepID=E3GNS8_9FIRM|nr:hypothetical protein ELI_2338 [Eubacterium callanderi]
MRWFSSKSPKKLAVFFSQSFLKGNGGTSKRRTPKGICG